MAFEAGEELGVFAELLLERREIVEPEVCRRLRLKRRVRLDRGVPFPDAAACGARGRAGEQERAGARGQLEPRASRTVELLGPPYPHLRAAATRSLVRELKGSDKRLLYGDLVGDDGGTLTEESPVPSRRKPNSSSRRTT